MKIGLRPFSVPKQSEFRLALNPAVHVLLCKTIRRWGLARFRQDEYHKVVLI
jgi:hypothetical protein